MPVYTRFGYGEIDLAKCEKVLESPNALVIVQVNLRGNAIAYVQVRFCGIINNPIQRTEVKSRVTVAVKTLYGKRIVHQFEVSVMEKIQQIMELLKKYDPEEM